MALTDSSCCWSVETEPSLLVNVLAAIAVYRVGGARPLVAKCLGNSSNGIRNASDLSFHHQCLKLLVKAHSGISVDLFLISIPTALAKDECEHGSWWHLYHWRRGILPHLIPSNTEYAHLHGWSCGKVLEVSVTTVDSVAVSSPRRQHVLSATRWMIQKAHH